MGWGGPEKSKNEGTQQGQVDVLLPQPWSGSSERPVTSGSRNLGRPMMHRGAARSSGGMESEGKV